MFNISNILKYKKAQVYYSSINQQNVAKRIIAITGREASSKNPFICKYVEPNYF